MNKKKEAETALSTTGKESSYMNDRKDLQRKW